MGRCRGDRDRSLGLRAQQWGQAETWRIEAPGNGVRTSRDVKKWCVCVLGSHESVGAGGRQPSSRPSSPRGRPRPCTQSAAPRARRTRKRYECGLTRAVIVGARALRISAYVPCGFGLTCAVNVSVVARVL
jgi:hypothetical protein